MARPQDSDAGWLALEARIAAALEPFVADLGPRLCAHGDWSDCEEDCEFNDTQPKQGAMPLIKNWSLVAALEDTLSEDPIIVLLGAPRQRNHETKGLLWVALYE